MKLEVFSNMLFKVIGVEIKEALKGFKDEGDALEEYQEKLSHYIEAKYMDFKEIRPLALKVRKKLKELYYPLSLEPIDQPDEKYRISKIEKLNMNEFFNASSKILIEDSAGMGKSTLMKILFLSFVEKIIEKNEGYYPIFLELRKYKKEESFENFIIRNILMISDVDDLKEIKNINRIKKMFFKSKFIYFLDGFDEVSMEDKSRVISEIKRITGSYHNNYYILSSRTESGLNNFSNFFKYQIKSLDFNEGKELLKKYVEEENTDFFIQLDQNREHLEFFLETPLLASLIYTAYIYKNDIPTSKRELYSRVYNALYAEHDSQSKENYLRDRMIGKEELDSILVDFSFSNIKGLKTTFIKDEIVSNLNKVLKRYDYSISIESILNIITTGTCLFGTNGNDYYWVHKSLQEYFISKKIKEHKDKEEIISWMLEEKNIHSYINILSFLYEMEPLLTKKIIYTLISEEFLKYDMYPERIQEKLILNGEFKFICTTKKQREKLELLIHGKGKDLMEYSKELLLSDKNFVSIGNTPLTLTGYIKREKRGKMALLRLLHEKKDECISSYRSHESINEIKIPKGKVFDSKNFIGLNEQEVDDLIGVLNFIIYPRYLVSKKKILSRLSEIKEKINEDNFSWK